MSKTITISTDDNDNDDDYNEGEEEEEEVKKTHKIWLQFKTLTSSARNVRSSKMLSADDGGFQWKRCNGRW